MKRTLSLLLAAALLLCLPCAASAEDFADSIAAQAFAVTVAYHEGGYFDTVTTADPALLWEATGWYAAWLYRTQGIELLSETQVRDFQRAVGNLRDAADPEWLESSLGIRTLRAAGERFYEFPAYRYRIDMLLGQTLEFILAEGAPPEAAVTLRQHYAAGAAADRVYTLSFIPNPDRDSAFPWRLESVKAPVPGPAIDAALNFDWDGLIAANSLKNIFSLFKCVKIQNNVEGVMPTWLFRHNGDLCILRVGEDYAEGEYRGCWFRYEPSDDGKLRPHITGFDPDCGDAEARDEYVSNYLLGAAIVDLDRMDGDLIRTHITYQGDWNEDVAVDRGLLLLRETKSRIDELSEPIVTTFTYGMTPPIADYLDSWDKPLREIRLVWEDWYTGEQRVREETVSVPADWEYLPWEARWDDYTIYMNEGYTQTYRYPGDGVEYTLYLTTAKG